MHRRFAGSALFAALVCLAGSASAVRADDYNVDPVHSSISFKIAHAGISWVHGRFNELSGSFTIDPESADKCSFALEIKAESVDTNNAKRDTHLKSPDFFNVKQFPTITFKSTSVKAIKDGYEVTGDLTLHGVTRPVTFALLGGRKVELPKGVGRIGFWTDFAIKRSDFAVGDDKFKGALGDEVPISIGLEGTKK
jgi:polyisoprenoid-binding protein YceI